MNDAIVDPIVRAVLYEGFILYPYRPSVKNVHRWTFGGLAPEAYSVSRKGSDPWMMQTECLVHGGGEARLEVKVRFLQLVARTVGQIDPPMAEWPAEGEPPFRAVQVLQLGQDLYQSWQEASEREVTLEAVQVDELVARPRWQKFTFPAGRETEALRSPDGSIGGVLVRRKEPIEGSVELSAVRVEDQLFKLTVRIANRTRIDAPDRTGRDEAMLRSLASTHTILHVEGGQFVSMIDPPERWRASAAGCLNIGSWPVLVGQAGETHTMLAAPIILYDYPQVAPESPGDLFDSTEIDEILSLRILTLTDDEKRSMASIDPRTRDLLSRTESLAREQLSRLHGTFRPGAGRAAAATPALRPGDRVRLRPQNRADIMDMALAGKLATIASIEQDLEDRYHVAVTVDDDPGRDLGPKGMLGHRFFFTPQEVELLAAGEGGGGGSAISNLRSQMSEGPLPQPPPGTPGGGVSGEGESHAIASDGQGGAT